MSKEPRSPISKLRQERRLSLRDFADKAGVDFTTVWRWEQGLQVPSLPKLRRVAKAFRVPVEKLL